jgi:hypothetical protein
LSTETTVLYVSGAGHSGSTLLDRMLTESGGFTSVGELRHLWRYDYVDSELCGCRRPLPACGFWSAVLASALGGHPADRIKSVRPLQAAVDRTRHLPRLLGRPRGPFRDRLEEYAAVLSRVYAAAARVGGSRVVVDTSKNLSTLLVLRWLGGTRVMNLHMVRDSRGTAASFRKQRRRPDFGARVVEEVRLGPVFASLNWNYLNAAIRLLARRIPTLVVRYEDLVADPRGTLERVHGFVQLEGAADFGFIEPGAVRLTAEHHGIHGNVGRFAQDGRVPLQLDDGWRTGLSAPGRFVVTALTWPLLVRYGYPLRPGAPEPRRKGALG